MESASLDSEPGSAQPRPRRARWAACTAAVALALAVLALAACSSAAPSASGSSSSGGELKIGLDSDPVCLDPTQTGLIASLVIGNQLVNTLLVANPTTGAIEPGLATSYTENSTATSFSFTLRSGVTFSNGQPLDAQAVKTYFDGVIAMGAKAVYDAAYLAGYSKTTVTGKLSLTVTFSTPNAQFVTALTTPSLGILAPASIAASTADRCAGKDLYGTGPFVFDSYSPNVSVVLSRRADYSWGTALGSLAASGHTGPAYVDKVDYLIEPDSSTRSGTLRSGQVDFATVIAPQDQPTFTGHGFSILSKVDPGVSLGMAPNFKGSAILRDPKVREAIQLGINRQQITDSLSPSYGVASSVLNSTTLGFKDLSKYLATNDTEAESILNADGWKVSSGGIRVKDGRSLTLTLVTFYDPNIYELAAAQLREIGVNVQVKVVATAQFQSLLTTGSYDLKLDSETHLDPDALRSEFSTTEGNTDYLTTSYPGVADFDHIEQQQLQTPDLATREQLAGQAQQILIENNYDFPLAQLTQVIGLSDKVTGLEYNALAEFVLYNVKLSS